MFLIHLEIWFGFWLVHVLLSGSENSLSHALAPIHPCNNKGIHTSVSLLGLLSQINLNFNANTIYNKYQLNMIICAEIETTKLTSRSTIWTNKITTIRDKWKTTNNERLLSKQFLSKSRYYDRNKWAACMSVRQHIICTTYTSDLICDLRDTAAVTTWCDVDVHFLVKSRSRTFHFYSS